MSFSESDNNVNMVENGTVVLESDGTVMVCARIEGVSEIERGFNGNFQFIRDEDLTGEAVHVVHVFLLSSS